MGTRRLGQRWAGHVFLLLGLVELFLSGAEGQHCGSLGQVNVCREDCGSCGAAPCCTLEWELQGTTPDEFTRLVLELLQNGGSDGLYKLEGHVPNYEDWNVDIADEYPKKIQVVHTPPQFAADEFALSEGRFDEITLSIYLVPPASSRVVAFSETKRHSAIFQCDGGTNYSGLFSLISGITQVPGFRERTLYGCREKDFGIIPQRAIDLALAS